MNSFFKDILKRLTVTIISTILFFVISLFIFSSVISSFVEETEKEPLSGSFLVINLSMNLTDRPSDLDLEDLTKEVITDEQTPPQFYLREVLDALKKAAFDDKIKGVFIEGGFIPSGYGCGYEAVKEFVRSLEDFKKSGKQIFGFISNPSKLDYLVYSVCDQIYMNPSGSLMLNGLASEQMFFAEALEKYGIGVQVIRVGEFKGAVEPFISTEFSEENKVQITRLLELRWQDYLETVCKNRKIQKAVLTQKLDEGFLLNPDKCIEIGLVDFAIPYADVLDKLIVKGVEDEESSEFAKIKLIDYVDRKNSLSDLDSANDSDFSKVAVLYIEGTIVDGWGDDGMSVGGDEIAKRIREIRKNPNYKALVLRINSPGGSVNGSDSILSEIRRARSEGLVIVTSMGPVAASGGYWVAMESDRIFAGEQTITGSIGVFGLLPNIKELASNFGLFWDVVKTDNSADIMSLTRAKSEEEIQVVQNYIEEIYEKFLSLVSQNRKMEINDIDKIAQGRVWMGIDAKEKGLVDEIGGLYDAIQHASDLAGITDFEIEDFPKIKNPFDALSGLFEVKFLNNLHKSHSGTSRSFFRHIDSLLIQIENLNDPRCAYSIIPWYKGQFGFTQ